MKYIYLFPDEGAMGNYKIDCKKFGLEYLGKNRFEGERNLVIRGELSNLKKYAEWLDYDLHPDYLYKENEFAGEIKDSKMKDESSDLTNIKVLKKQEYTAFSDREKHTLYLVEYIPQGALDRGDNRKLFATITDYKGEKVWTNGAIIDVSRRLAEDTFNQQLKLATKGVKAYLRGDSKMKDYKPELLAELKKIAEEGEKLKSNMDRNTEIHLNSPRSNGWETTKYDILSNKIFKTHREKAMGLIEKWNKIVEEMNRGKKGNGANFSKITVPKSYFFGSDILPVMSDYKFVEKTIKNLETSHGKKRYDDSLKSYMFTSKQSGNRYLVKANNTQDAITKFYNAAKVEDAWRKDPLVNNSYINSNGDVLFKAKEDDWVLSTKKEEKHFKSFKEAKKYAKLDVNNSVEDGDDYSYETIFKQISNNNFDTKYLLQKAYNGYTRGSMSKKEYDAIVKEIKAKREVNDSKVKDELIAKVWYEEDFKDPNAKSYWDREWKKGLELQKNNSNAFKSWVKKSYNELKEDLKEGYIKKEVLSELGSLLVNDSIKSPSER